MFFFFSSDNQKHKLKVNQNHTTMKTFRCLSLLIVTLICVSCGTYKKTIIDPNLRSDLDSKASYNKITVLCGYYTMKKVHDLSKSHKTAFNRDQELARSVADAELKELCGSNPNCSQSYFLTMNQGSVTTDKYIDFKIYQFVNWTPVWIQILPTYYSCTESVCATAEVYEGGKVVKKFEEWAYTKDRGFWFIPLSKRNQSIPVRNFVAKKVLNEALSFVN